MTPSQHKGTPVRKEVEGGPEPAQRCASAPSHEAGGSGKSRLQAAVEAGQALGKLALYFGCWDRVGHYLHKPGGSTLWSPQREVPGFPWTEAHIDAGLLKNGKHADRYDGKVFWTCGGRSFWYAFFWWDNSVDSRGASNSGFYVRGFGWPDAQAAFDYACGEFPGVVSRQKHPLILQAPPAGDGAGNPHPTGLPRESDKLPNPNKTRRAG